MKRQQPLSNSWLKEVILKKYLEHVNAINAEINLINTITYEAISYYVTPCVNILCTGTR